MVAMVEFAVRNSTLKYMSKLSEQGFDPHEILKILRVTADMLPGKTDEVKQVMLRTWTEKYGDIIQ